MGLHRQEYWRGLPFPSPGDLPNPGIELGSSALQGDSLLSELPGKPEAFLGGTWWWLRVFSGSPSNPVLGVILSILFSTFDP